MTVGPVAESVRQKLSLAFLPSHLQVWPSRRPALAGADVFAAQQRSLTSAGNQRVFGTQRAEGFRDALQGGGCLRPV